MNLDDLLRDYQGGGGDDDAQLRIANELILAVLPAIREYVGRKCHKNDADDVVQETLIKIMRGMHRSTVKSFMGWSIGVARNVIADRYRRQEVGLESLDDPGIVEEIRKMRLSSDPAKQAYLLGVFDALQAFGKKCRDLIWSYLILGFTHSEIAKSLGVNEDTARKRFDDCHEHFLESLNRKNS